MKRLLASLPLLLLLTSPAWASWSRIQRVSFSNVTGGATSTTITSTGAGHIIIIELTWYKSTNCLTNMTAPTDNKGGGSSTYTADLPAVNPDDGKCIGVWSVPNCASGITSVTNNPQSVGTYVIGFIEEWSGAATSSPFDKSANTSNTGTSFVTGTTATLTGSTDLAIGIGFQTNNTTTTLTPTGGSGDLGTATEGVSCGCSSYVENKVLAATTGIQLTGTFSTSFTFSAAVVTYQAAGVGGVVRKRAMVVNNP